ncbi:uncharacterized protein [Centruroides vittatus]|uniref:uncharacterized protein n=1 Tax=Centruroides vittatus TaxID=120091 RepID=UPI003510A383
MMYGLETRTMSVAVEEPLRRWERKILRKIFGAVRKALPQISSLGSPQWRMRKNSELVELYGYTDIVVEIKYNRLRWLGHIKRMSDDRAAKRICRRNLGGRRFRRRPQNIWMDDVDG